jgi:cold shock CspA family protein
MSNIIKGKLKRWNEARGFGFIEPISGNSDIFIHISALKNMSRRPVIGDLIYFQLQTDTNRKSKAVNAKIEGVSTVKQKTKENRTKATIDNSWVARVICILAILTISIILIGRFVQERNISQLAEDLSSSSTDLAAPMLAPSTDHILQRAYNNRQSDLQVQGEGTVIKILRDDVDGARHQRFILKLSNGQTLLVAHNIDLASRIKSLSTGDVVEFYGEYEWNSQGGVIHWTHHDPNNQHEAGWLDHNGITYQ